MTGKSYPSRASARDLRTDNHARIFMLFTTVILALVVLSIPVDASYVYSEGKPYKINFIKQDPDYPVTVYEVSKTHTRFCVKSKILDIDIPLKTYTNDLTKELTKTLDKEEFYKFKDEFEQKCYDVYVDDITKAQFKFGLNSTEWTYNETYTNVACSGNWDGGSPCSNVYDGNWGTIGKCVDASGVWAYAQMNYTKINLSEGFELTSGTLWQVKDNDGERNLTINDTCWKGYTDKLVLRAGSYVDAGTSIYRYSWDCFNSTDWLTVSTTTENKHFLYEEGIFWKAGRTQDWYDENLLMDCAEIGVDDVATPLIFHNYLESSLDETNATLDITFDLLNVEENQTNNYSFAFDSNVTHSICMWPTNASYEINAFGIYSDNESISQRSYYVYNGTLTNQTQTVNLYSLETEDSDPVVIYVKDSSGLYVEDVYIKVQRYYPGTNTYKTVAYLKTDEDGKDMTYLYLNDVYYKFILEQNGVIVNEISPRTITNTVDDPEEITFSLTGTDLEYFQYGDISVGCTWNNATFTLRCTVSDSSNLMVESCLKTDKLGVLAPETVNETCDTDSAVTHIHVVGNNTGEYKYTLTISTANNLYNAETGSFVIEGPGSDFGDWGLMVVFLFVMVCSGLSMAYPPAGGVMAVIGLILGMAIGMIELTGASIIGLLIVAFIYLWKGRS